MSFYRFLLFVALAWVAAVILDAAPHPPKHPRELYAPSAPYIQPHHH